MKKGITTILSVCFAICTVNADSPDLQLKLQSRFHTLRIGQFKDLELHLSGNKIDDITKGSEGISNWKKNGFVYKFRFQPEKEGMLEVGPYSIDLDGKKITSNSIDVEVLPKWEGKYGTFFRTHTNSITLGQDFEFVIETWSTNKIDYSSMSASFQDDDSFSAKGIGSYSSANISTKEPSYYYKAQSFLITPKNEGEFRVTKDLFRKYPVDLESPNISITVKNK